MAGKEKEILTRTTGEGIDIEIPLGVIEGAEEGPTLCVTAGVHATEYVGQETALRLFRSIDPRDITGKILIVLVADAHALLDWGIFGYRVEMKYAGTGLSTAFPGREDGSYTEALAHTLINEVASKADCLVDLHGEELHGQINPYVICPKGRNQKVDKASFALAQVFDLPYIRWADLGKISQRKSLGDLLRIPWIVSEVGGNGRREQEVVDVDFKGMLNVLKHLGMMEGEPEQTVEPKVLAGSHWLTADVDGIFYPTVSIDESVNKGQALGELRDYFGEVLYEIVAPTDGVVMSLNLARSVRRGVLLLWLGVI